MYEEKGNGDINKIDNLSQSDCVHYLSLANGGYSLWPMMVTHCGCDCSCDCGLDDMFRDIIESSIMF